MSPLPGSAAVHPDWSRHHQPVASSGMNATCRVTDPARATPGGWNNDTGTYDPSVPFIVLEGTACRVQALRGDQPSEQAGQDSTTRAYLVQLDDPNLTTLPDIEVGYVLEVLTAVNDPHLPGLALRVTDVQHGSERFTRDLIVEHNQQDEGGTS